MCFGFDVADFVTESNEVGVVCFEPLRITFSRWEVWMCENSGQKIQVRLDARYGRILNGATGFADSIVPCTSCYDDLRNDAVEVWTDAGRDTVNERRVNADSIA